MAAAPGGWASSLRGSPPISGSRLFATENAIPRPPLRRRGPLSSYDSAKLSRTFQQRSSSAPGAETVTADPTTTARRASRSSGGSAKPLSFQPLRKRISAYDLSQKPSTAANDTVNDSSLCASTSVYPAAVEPGLQRPNTSTTAFTSPPRGRPLFSAEDATDTPCIEVKLVDDDLEGLGLDCGTGRHARVDTGGGTCRLDTVACGLGTLVDREEGGAFPTSNPLKGMGLHSLETPTDAGAAQGVYDGVEEEEEEEDLGALSLSPSTRPSSPETVVLTIPLPRTYVPQYAPPPPLSEGDAQGGAAPPPLWHAPGSILYDVEDEESGSCVPAVIILPPSELGVTPADIRAAAIGLRAGAGPPELVTSSSAAAAAILAAGIPEEERHLDYAPITAVHPIDMEYIPRAVRSARKIRLFIAVTCYNEEGGELQRTLAGIALNLPKLAGAGLHWSEVAVLVILDGRAKLHPSMEAFLGGGEGGAAGQGGAQMYRPELVAAASDGAGWPTHVAGVEVPGEGEGCAPTCTGPALPPASPVTLHVFERTVALGRARAWDQKYAPLQLIVAVKERNAGKLNSHLWFFAGFCTRLNPKYTLLLDCGTVPRRSAIARLYRNMEADPCIGGACGEIAIRGLRPWLPVEAAQAFEYAASHAMEKTTESALGLIGCLPGAFSLYRWCAIRGEPLVAYFRLEEAGPVKDVTPFTANMYLAEDRVLATEVMAKKSRAWGLRYYAGAVADTDVPDTLVGLLKQRRRWLNGTFFSLIYVLSSYRRFFSEARHGVAQRVCLLLQLPLLLSSAFTAWFGVGLLYLTFLLVALRVTGRGGVLTWGGPEILTLFRWGYALTLAMQLVVAMGAGSGKLLDAVAPFYLILALLYGVLILSATALGLWLVALGGFSPWVILGLAVSTGSVLASAALHGSLLVMLTTAPQYLALSALFVNVFPIFSFANAHDVSWGTRDGSLHVQQQAAAAGAQALQGAPAQAQSEGAAPSDGHDALGTPHPASTTTTTRSTTAGQAHDRRLSVLSSGEGGALEGRTPGPLRARLALPPTLPSKSTAPSAAHVELAQRRAIEADKASAQQAFALFRLRLVGAWVASNTLLVALVEHFDPTLAYFAFAVVCLGAYAAGFRTLGSMVYWLRLAGVSTCRQRACVRACYRTIPVEDHTPQAAYQRAMAVAWQGTSAVGTARVGAAAVRELALRVYNQRQRKREAEGREGGGGGGGGQSPPLVGPPSVAGPPSLSAAGGGANRTGRVRHVHLLAGTCACTARPPLPFRFDDAWEGEHPYAHAYPLPDEEVGEEAGAGCSTPVPPQATSVAVHLPPTPPVAYTHRHAQSALGSTTGRLHHSLVPDAGYDPDAVRLHNRRAGLQGKKGSAASMAVGGAPFAAHGRTPSAPPQLPTMVQAEEQFLTIVLKREQLPH